jgi:DNA-binding protein HU-beta
MDLRPPTLTKVKLAREVATILQIPYLERKGEAYRTVKAIFEVITKALLRGETVRVTGLGTFSIRRRPARKRQRTPVWFLGVGKGPCTILKTKVPAKNYVHFRPARAIRQIQEPPPLPRHLDPTFGR